MSFVRRSSSFAAVKRGQPPRTSHIDHDYFYDKDDIRIMKAGGMPKLAEFGMIQGLAEAFRTSTASGLYADELSSVNGLKERRERYGENVVPRKELASWFELAWEALGDFMLRVLIFAATLSLVLETVEEPKLGWINGVAIYFAIIIVTTVTATNNYQKERQFRAMEETAETKCTVVRNGVESEVDSKELVVGDLVVLKQGDGIVADGIFISGNGLSMDESGLTGESDSVPKDAAHPFILSGTAVLDGEGIMLVIAVGVESTRGQIAASLESELEETPLQIRLEILAEQVGKVGTAVALLLFIVLMIYWIVEVVTHHKNAVKELPHILHFFIISVTVIVVAIPEGLPLAVTISLAYSMSKMMHDNNLVRVLSACETMGNATMICSDKTGTLTQNRMTVIKAVIGGKFYRDALPTAQDLPEQLRGPLLEGEAVNSKVYLIKPKPEKDALEGAPAVATPAPKYTGGNQTACAMLAWAVSLGCDYDAIRKKIPIEKAYPFNSAKKSSSVLVKRPGQGGEARLYVKGAVEAILLKTQTYVELDGRVLALTEETRARLVRFVDSMTRTGLRCLAMAYQDFPAIRYDEAGEVIDHAPEDEEFTLLAIVGIKDPLRPGVQEAVKTMQNAGIVIRMVTGDHLETAKFIARDAGILTHPDQVSMTGPDFRAMTESEKEQTIPNLRVLARSSPLDKEIMVRWLKDHGEVVAVTGDGTNDAPALKEADVGLAMGIAGTDVAKNAAAIIILDDDFCTIVKSVMWGRSVFDNIRKFVQFQITINIVALTVTFVGAFNNSGKTPLSAVQLLWVNLIMDTLAALALGTEMPSLSLLDRKPYAKDSPLISPVMWRNMIGQVFLQLTIIFMILYGGNQIWGISTKDDNLYIRTMVFNSFVFLQLFNELNSRKCNGEVNIFEKFFDNWIFTGVLVFSVGMQALMVQVFGSFASTTPLTGQHWGVCIGLGFISMPVGFLVRFIPVDFTKGQIELDPKTFQHGTFPDADPEFEAQLANDMRAVEKSAVQGKDMF